MFQLPVRLHGAVPVPDDSAGGARAHLLVPARGLRAQPRALPPHQQQAQAAPGRLAAQRSAAPGSVPDIYCYYLVLVCFFYVCLLKCIKLKFTKYN